MKRKIVLGLAAIISCLAMTGCAVVRSVGNGLTNLDYDFADKYLVGGGTINENIDTIDINWVSGKIDIVAEDVEDITISEKCDSSNDEFKLRYLVVDGTLRVQFAKSGKWNFNNVKKELKIVIPKNLNLKKFEMDMVSSVCKLDGINAKDIKIDGVSGDVEMINCFTDAMELNTVSGALNYTGNINNSVKADTVSGDINLNLPADTGFKAKISAVSGRFDSDFDYTGEKNKYQCGDGSLNIEMNAVSGSLRVKKQVNASDNSDKVEKQSEKASSSKLDVNGLIQSSKAA